jgi:hypothetical protein
MGSGDAGVVWNAGSRVLRNLKWGCFGLGPISVQGVVVIGCNQILQPTKLRQFAPSLPALQRSAFSAL